MARTSSSACSLAGVAAGSGLGRTDGTEALAVSAPTGWPLR